jgi:hypothetical protein
MAKFEESEEEFENRASGQRQKPPNDDPEVQDVYAVTPVPRPPKPARRRIRREYEEDSEGEEEDWRRADGGISTLIPYKNPKALIAYYLGIFGLIPCFGAILGPAALVLGILGLLYLNKRPGAKGIAHAIVGIVLGSLETLGNWAVIVTILLKMPGA